MKKTIIALGSLVAVNSAFAAGFGIYEASARGNAMGGALVGATGDATANYYNPANITDATNIQFAAGVTFIKPTCDVEVGHKSQGKMDPGWFTVPSAYLTLPLPYDFALGWGNYTEFGLGSKYGRCWDLSHDTQQTTIEQMTLNPNLAYKIADWWSLAAGPRVSWISFTNYKQIPTAAYGMMPGYYIDSKLKGDDWAGGWTVSSSFKLHERVRLGVLYRSEINHKIKGKFNLDTPLAAAGIPAPGTLAIYNNNSANARLTLPQSVTAGINWDVTDDWRLGLVGTWTDWRSVKKINFRLGDQYSNTERFAWRQAYRVGIGTEYDVTDWMQARCGYTYDRDPSSKTHASTMLPAGDRHIIGLGLGFNVIENLWLDLSYNFIRMNNEHYYVAGQYVSNRNGFSHLAGVSLRYSF